MMKMRQIVCKAGDLLDREEMLKIMKRQHKGKFVCSHGDLKKISSDLKNKDKNNVENTVK